MCVCVCVCVYVCVYVCVSVKGVVPLDYLGGDDEQKAEAILQNAKQILEQFKVCFN